MVATLPVIDLSAPNYDEALLHIGVTGCIRYAPLSVDLPAENLGDYPEGWVDLGWIGEDGLEENPDEEFKDIKPFNASDAGIRRKTKDELEYGLTMWSITGMVNALFYDVPEENMAFDEKSGVTRIVKGKGGKLPPQLYGRFAWDVIEGDKHKRIILPKGYVSERSAQTYKIDELRGVQLKFRGARDVAADATTIIETREGWQPGKAGSIFGGEDGRARDYGAWNAALAPAAAEEDPDGES